MSKVFDRIKESKEKSRGTVYLRFTPNSGHIVVRDDIRGLAIGAFERWVDGEINRGDFVHVSDDIAKVVAQFRKDANLVSSRRKLGIRDEIEVEGIRAIQASFKTQSASLWWATKRHSVEHHLTALGVESWIFDPEVAESEGSESAGFVSGIGPATIDLLVTLWLETNSSHDPGDIHAVRSQLRAALFLLGEYERGQFGGDDTGAGMATPSNGLEPGEPAE